MLASLSATRLLQGGLPHGGGGHFEWIISEAAASTQRRCSATGVNTEARRPTRPATQSVAPWLRASAIAAARSVKIPRVRMKHLGQLPVPSPVDPAWFLT